MNEDVSKFGSQKSEKVATIAGHVIGWPLYLVGLGLWALAVVPYWIRQNQGIPTMEIDKGLAGFVTVIFLVLSGVGLLLIVAALRKRLLVVRWILLVIYLVVLFLGVVVASG